MAVHPMIIINSFAYMLYLIFQEKHVIKKVLFKLLLIIIIIILKVKLCKWTKLNHKIKKY